MSRQKTPERREADPKLKAAHENALTVEDVCPSSSDWWVDDDVPGWVDILQALEDGRLPDKELLVSYLRDPRYVVDQRIRNYLADHIEGKIRKPIGRPVDISVDRIVRDFIVRIVYWRIYYRLVAIPRSERLGTASEVALEEAVTKLAERNVHMSAGQVRKIVYPEGTSRSRRST
jgi:hypothetical protein